MSVIERAKAIVAKIPEASYEIKGNYIAVHPASPGGFAVTLIAAEQGHTVYFNGWHEEFASEDEALSCFIFGLSPACRLKVQRRGDTPQKWTVEWFKDNEWREDSIVGLLFFPFWWRVDVVYLQNSLIEATNPE